MQYHERIIKTIYLVEDVLNEAYYRAKLDPYDQPVWSDVDAKIMDVLSPVHRELIALLDTELSAFKAIDNEMVTCCLGVCKDPVNDLYNIINWHVDVALDPAVSSDAAALIEKGRSQAC